MILKGQGHRSEQMAPSDSLDLENIYLDAKIIILSTLLWKLGQRFLYNGGQRNAFAYVSPSNRSRCFFFFIYLKAPTQATLC